METTQLPLHAEYLLMAVDATGHRRIDAEKFKAGLAGAAVVELALQEALVLEGEGRKARFRATGADIDPSLEESLQRADGRSPKDAVARIGGASSMRDRAGELAAATWAGLERLEAVQRVEGKALGIFPTTRWVERNPELRARLTERVTQALLAQAAPDRRTASLVSLLHATGLLAKVVRDPALDRSSIRARGKRIADSDWGSDAVSRAIKDVEGAAMAAITASIVVTAAS